MIRVSVVLPCYKVEPFVETIFNDLQAQTFSGGEIEFIFVDDGGSDAQASLLDDLSLNDARVVVSHKKNGGVSSARNAGIDLARGEWIVFVDPDDRLKIDHLQRLYDAVSQGEDRVDAVFGGYDQCFEGESRVSQMHITIPDSCRGYSFSPKECFGILPELVFASVWGKIYNTAFLRENHIRFNETMRFNEDTCFNVDVFRKAHWLSLLEDSGYIYYKYQNSTACSSYLPDLKVNNMNRINMLCKLRTDFKEAPELVAVYREDQLCILAYLIACNPFKQNSPLSFAECVQYLRAEIFSDVEMLDALKNRNTKADNKALRLCFGLINMGSPVLLSLVFRMLYGMKYSMNGLFRRLKRAGTKE